MEILGFTIHQNVLLFYGALLNSSNYGTGID